MNISMHASPPVLSCVYLHIDDVVEFYTDFLSKSVELVYLQQIMFCSTLYFRVLQ
jgi:hypothetical protein